MENDSWRRGRLRLAQDHRGVLVGQVHVDGGDQRHGELGGPVPFFLLVVLVLFLFLLLFLVLVLFLVGVLEFGFVLGLVGFVLEFGFVLVGVLGLVFRLVPRVLVDGAGDRIFDVAGGGVAHRTLRLCTLMVIPMAAKNPIMAEPP
jgi:hypothetical protein